ncbi:hypothetical protein [Faecalibacterium hattorii]
MRTTYLRRLVVPPYRKMNKDGKAWTAQLSHVIYRMTPTTLEKP